MVLGDRDLLDWSLMALVAAATDGAGRDRGTRWLQMHGVEWMHE